MVEPAARTVRCPRCRSPSPFARTNRWRPFCSERCATVDLGAWASESYRVDAAAPPAPDLPPPDAASEPRH